MFNVLYVSTLLLLVCACGSVDAGRFSTAEGSECVWFEKEYESHTRGIVLICNCQGAEGLVNYTCEYKGDLKECQTYHRKSHVFWEQLVQFFRNNIQNRCNLLSLSAKMWLQQYKAMFLKRWYNFKRFLPALIWQLLLPLVFVILGLVLAAVIPASHDEDPLRKMSLDSSAPSETRTIFWSQHSSANLSSIPFTMQDLENPLYGLTNKKVENYTLGVVNLYEEVQTGRSVEDCCNYTFQLLDKYCATRKKNEIVEKCSSDEEFGYHDCLNRCFSCCEARHHQLPSCSNPRFQQLCDISCYPNVSQFCSAPPKLSLGDFQNPEGPLDDMNAFVAEYILQSAANNTASYYQHVLGGFSIVEEQPAYSVCGCEDGKGEDGSCPGSLNQLELMNSGLMSEESPAIPPLPIFCDDNATTIAETLGVSISGLVEVPATSSNASSTFQVIPSVKPHVLLSMLPSCQSVDNMTSFCLDGSCHADKQCNTSNQSLASQYGNIINQGRTSITVWYNNQPYHVSPSILNVLHNLYLRGNESFANHSITVYNHPLPRRPMSTVGAVESDLLSFVVGAASILGSSFLLASFSTFIVQEKSSKAKHLQMASGLQLTAYWVANLTADLIIALLFVLSSLVLFAIFQPFVPAYSGQALAAVLLLLVLLCWSSTPLVYFISLAFQNIYTAFTVILIMFFMTSLICLALLYIVGVLANFRDEADIFYYIFIFHPGFGFAAALSDLYIANVYQDACVQSNLTRTICDQIGVDYTTGPFAFFRPGCGAIITVLAAEGFLFFLLTILVDHWSQILQFIQSKKKRRYPIKKRDPSSLLMMESRQFSTSNFGRLPRSLSAMSRAFFETVDDEETDVEAILSQDTIDPQYTVLVYDMEKNYHTEQYCSSLTENANVRPAVNGLIFKVEAGECFGLLGVNGAGKSTTFKILTGDISMTSGTAIIAGFDIRTQLRQVQQRIGYCPQFDALIERLTGRELLTMFARLRGIQEKDIKKEVDDKLERLQLSIHADKECWKYSGGNKRKLSTAIALIGDTKVIFLDEPTTGMDIDTRKHFITTLQNVVQEENRSIVLTSHSMAECEALCNRIGIMVDGKFKCIGSKEVLKDQYGEKFTKLMIRVQSTSAAADAASAATAAVAGSRHQSVEEVDYAGNRRMSSALSRIQHTISRQGQRILNLARRGQSRGAGSREEVDAVLEDTSIQRVQQAVLHTFSGRIADQDPIDVQNDSITFQLPKNSVPLSEIFDVMERLHRDTSLGIVGYSVSQSTLNQVFNRIVNGHQDRANSIP